MAESVNEMPKLEIRDEWYQTESDVVITLFVKNLNDECFKANFEDNTVIVNITKSDFQPYQRTFNLSEKIIPDRCGYKITPSKIEIKLRKYEGIRWEKLEGHPQHVKQIKLEEVVPKHDKPPSYPTSKKGKDWSVIEKEITQQEAEEKPEGEEAVNKLFKDIYGKGNDDVKKAMLKSFMESGGTVLSTNWDKVSKETVKVQPPDGMEYKKWN